MVRWRARTIVQRHGALRARRPQLKRDPLGRETVDSASVLRSAQRMIVAAYVLCLIAFLWIVGGLLSSRFPVGLEGRLEGVVHTFPVAFLALILDVGGSIQAFRALARSAELRTTRNRLFVGAGILASPFLAWYVWHFALLWLIWITGVE